MYARLLRFLFTISTRNKNKGKRKAGKKKEILEEAEQKKKKPLNESQKEGIHGDTKV